MHILRYDGSDGDISCVLNSNTDFEIKEKNKRHGVEDVDFEPIDDRRIEFKHNVEDIRIELIIPEALTE